MKVFAVIIAATTFLPSTYAKLQFGRRVSKNNNDDSSITAAPVEDIMMSMSAEEVNHDDEEIPPIDPTRYIGKSLRQAVEELIVHSERELIPKFLRLGFHDCVGGCDGCVDLSNPDNKGLLEPIEHLATLYNTFKIMNPGMYSRADVWAMATMVSAEKSLVMLSPSGELIDQKPPNLLHLQFPLTHIGRIDCDGADEKGIGGPDVPMPSNDLSTHELLTFFREKFNFNTHETVAIMGAHSVAVATRENVGFGNLGLEEGWVCHAEEYLLDNRFYGMLDGDVQEPWMLEFVDNSGLSGNIPNRFQWTNEARCETERPIMTNADMALVRDFKDYISSDGKVSCTFGYVAGKTACPLASETFDRVNDYKMDNMLFLEDFEKVLGKMVQNGYNTAELKRV